MLRLSIGYPAPEDERAMVLLRQNHNPLQDVQQVVTKKQLQEMQEQAASVYTKKEVIDYIIALIGATRKHGQLLRGASPRATLSVTAMAKSVAYLSGRDYLLPGDVQTVFVNTVAHRLLLTPEAENAGVSTQNILEAVLKATPAPKLR